MAVDNHINHRFDLRAILWTDRIANTSKTAINFSPNIQKSIVSVSNSEVICQCKNINAVWKGTLEPDQSGTNFFTKEN